MKQLRMYVAPILTVLALAGTVKAQITQFCFPGQGGVRVCPCANPPAGGGLGCDNFGAGPAQSGTLNATGNPSLIHDTVLLVATGENASAKTVFYSGTSTITAGVVFGAGIRCVAGNLQKLYPYTFSIFSIKITDPGVSSSGGAITRPQGFFFRSVSLRSKDVGQPITPGTTHYYFCQYSDPLAAAQCGYSAATFNATNAVSIVWGP